MDKVARALLWQSEAWQGPRLRPEQAEQLARQLSTLNESVHTLAELVFFEAEPADFVETLASTGPGLNER